MLSRFQLTRSVLAVHYGRNPQTTLLTLPVGARVSVLGPSSIPACVEIDCKRRRYHIFEIDLLSRSKGRASAAKA
jgi:hypothetical protein